MLNLDTDQVRPLIGGWRQRDAETGEIVQPLALSMAAAHLRGGCDVVMPQVLCQLDEIALFEAAAHDNGAAFCQVVLMDTKQQLLLERCNRRGEHGAQIWHQQVQEIRQDDRARIGWRAATALIFTAAVTRSEAVRLPDWALTWQTCARSTDRHARRRHASPSLGVLTHLPGPGGRPCRRSDRTRKEAVGLALVERQAAGKVGPSDRSPAVWTASASCGHAARRGGAIRHLGQSARV